jgi:hypothetical protein
MITLSHGRSVSATSTRPSSSHPASRSFEARRRNLTIGGFSADFRPFRTEITPGFAARRDDRHDPRDRPEKASTLKPNSVSTSHFDKPALTRILA